MLNYQNLALDFSVFSIPKDLQLLHQSKSNFVFLQFPVTFQLCIIREFKISPPRNCFNDFSQKTVPSLSNLHQINVK